MQAAGCSTHVEVVIKLKCTAVSRNPLRRLSSAGNCEDFWAEISGNVLTHGGSFRGEVSRGRHAIYTAS